MTKYQFHELSQTNSKQYHQLQWQQYKQTINRQKSYAEKNVCVQAKRVEVIKQILTMLLDKNKNVGYYTREDIDTAILLARGLVDPRSRNKWWNYLWKAGYFTQSQLGIYHLELEKVVALELKCPIQIDKNQRRLASFDK